MGQQSTSWPGLNAVSAAISGPSCSIRPTAEWTGVRKTQLVLPSAVEDIGGIWENVRCQDVYDDLTGQCNRLWSGLEQKRLLKGVKYRRVSGSHDVGIV